MLAASGLPLQSQTDDAFKLIPCIPAPARQAVGRVGALLRAIRDVLRVALANRGTSMRDFVDAEGRSGDNARPPPGSPGVESGKQQAGESWLN